MNKSQSGWHRLRHYSGISPGSVYRFTIFSEEPLPDELRFELGIKRTGYVVATEVPQSETVDLNEYLLKEVYDVPNEEITGILKSGSKYYPASDTRVSRYANVPFDTAKQLVEDYDLYRDNS